MNFDKYNSIREDHYNPTIHKIIYKKQVEDKITKYKKIVTNNRNKNLINDYIYEPSS